MPHDNYSKALADLERLERELIRKLPGFERYLKMTSEERQAIINSHASRTTDPDTN
jgi:hypothetical protein